MLGFSFKAILIKLAYAWHPVDAVTLLALRMLYSAPFFVAMAWWAGAGRTRARSRAATGCGSSGSGFIGYYLASLLDFMGLAIHHARRSSGSCCSSIRRWSCCCRRCCCGKPITRRAVVALVALVCRHRARRSRTTSASAATARATLTGGALVFGSALCYALYLVDAGARDRAPRQRALHRLGDARVVACSCSPISR